MVSIIDDKKYQLITKSENFEFAYDLYNNFDSIKSRLIQEFWDKLSIMINKNLQNSDITEEGQCITFNTSSLGKIIYYYWISQNRFEYGIEFNHNGTKKTVMNIEDNFIDLFEHKYDNQKEKAYSLFHRQNEDFSKLSGLVKILPENRNELIEKYATDFKDMKNKLDNMLIEFEKTLK